MKRWIFDLTLSLLFGIFLAPQNLKADADMTVKSEKSATTSFDVPPLPTGEFTPAQEKERRAKAAEIARRAQEKENSKAREHNGKLHHKQKRKVASVSRPHAVKHKARPSRDKVVTDSDL